MDCRRWEGVPPQASQSILWMRKQMIRYSQHAGSVQGQSKQSRSVPKRRHPAQHPAEVRPLFLDFDRLAYPLKNRTVLVFFDYGVNPLAQCILKCFPHRRKKEVKERLEDEDVRVAVGLRLGVAIYEPHMCACGARIDARGSHGLSCSLGFGRIHRHSTINDIIHCSLSKAGIPSIKKPPGLTRTDGRRPEGLLTMIPWRAGRHLVWDTTVVDTLVPSYVQAS